MNTLDLPTPAITTPHSFHEPGRSREAVWHLIPATDTEPGTAVKLRVAHSKTSKCFTAHLQPMRVEPARETGFSSETYHLFSGVRIDSEKVARFSAKALDEYAAKALAKAEALIATDARIAALFTDPEASNKMFGKD